MLFKEDAICYQENVMFMPEACFPFYTGAYMRYLLSDDSEGDCDGASCFFALVEFRVAETSSDRRLAAEVNEVLDHLVGRQDWYKADRSIYGNFADRAATVRSQLHDAASGT